MTKEQTNRALFLVALLALFALAIEALTLPYLYGIFLIAPFLGGITVIGTIILLSLVAAPFLKQNLLLFLILIDCFLGSSLANNIQSLYSYLIGSSDLATIGIVPGVVECLSTVLLDITTLIILGLRIYGYLKEHRAGLDTKF